MKTANSIFKLMAGTAMILCSLSFLILVTKSANAVEEPVTYPTMPAEEMGGGKYTLQYATGQNGDGTFYWQMIVFNRSNGMFRAYSWDREKQGWFSFFPEAAQFPALP